MFRYSVFGLTVATELEIPELPAAFGEPDITVSIDRESSGLTVTKDRDDIFHPRRVGRFLIRDGCQIIVQPVDGADPVLVQNRLLGRALAILLRQRGWFPLHASAVLVFGRAILFAGPSGAGKSTIAAALYARGHRVICDDVTPLRAMEGRCEALPGRSRIKLCDDSRPILEGTGPSTLVGEKYLFDATPPVGTLAHETPGTTAVLRGVVPVAGICILDYKPECEPEPVLELISPAVSVGQISGNAYAPLRAGRQFFEDHLQKCVSLAEATTVYRLKRQRHLSGLKDVVDLIEREAAKM